RVPLVDPCGLGELRGRERAFVGERPIEAEDVAEVDGEQIECADRGHEQALDERVASFGGIGRGCHSENLLWGAPDDLPLIWFVRSRHVPFEQPSVIGRVVIVAAVVTAATSVSAVVVPRQGHGARIRAGAEAGEEHEATRTIRGASCGVERWPVKTLSDPRARDIDFAVRPATVRYLGSLRASPGGQDSRGALESRVFGVQARLVGVKREADSDYR